MIQFLEHYLNDKLLQAGRLGADISVRAGDCGALRGLKIKTACRQ
jgi:hypothetical protein